MPSSASSSARSRLIPAERLPQPGPHVRPARTGDLRVVQSIYAHHVLHGLASFEESPPPLEEIERRYRDVIDRGLPYLVAEAGGVVAGYGYCAPYRARSAYR